MVPTGAASFLTETNNYLFEFTEWIGINSTAASQGGALHCHTQPNLMIRVRHCTFDTCTSASAGGGLGFWTISSGFVINSSFTSCSAGGSGGGIYFYNTSTCASIRDCVCVETDENVKTNKIKRIMGEKEIMGLDYREGSERKKAHSR